MEAEEKGCDPGAPRSDERCAPVSGSVPLPVGEAESPVLANLLARVEAAEGADEQLSFAIDKALWAPNYDGSAWTWYGGQTHPTASLDKALALVERVLPGALRQFYERNTSANGRDWVVHLTPAPALVDTWTAKASTPALALLAALLKAKLSEAPLTSLEAK